MQNRAVPMQNREQLHENQESPQIQTPIQKLTMISHQNKYLIYFYY